MGSASSLELTERRPSESVAEARTVDDIYPALPYASRDLIIGSLKGSRALTIRSLEA